MTALSDALAQAQAKAIAAVSKAYVAGAVDDGAFFEELSLIGATDQVEQRQLQASLAILRQYGAPAPDTNGKPYSERRETEPATQAQRDLIDRMCRERSFELPDYAGVTKPQASQMIQELQAGSYDPDKYTIPF